MKPEILIPLGIFLAAVLILAASVAWVIRSLLRRSALARKEIEEACPRLFEQNYRFQTSVSLFAPVVSGQLKDGTNVTLNFRVPGRGYTGRMNYDGITLYLLQLTNFSASKTKALADTFENFPGTIVYQSESRIQWQPTAESPAGTPLDTENLIAALNQAT